MSHRTLPTIAWQFHLQLLELEDTVDVLDMLREIDVGANRLTIVVDELGPENGDLALALNGELNVLGVLGEVGAEPFELAWIHKHMVKQVSSYNKVKKGTYRSCSRGTGSNQ